MNIELILIKLHPASVHFPIALLLLASLCGLLYVHWKGLPPQAPYRDVLNWHITTGLAQIVVYGGLLYQRWRYPLLTKKRGKRIGAPVQQEGDLLDQADAGWWITILLLAGMVLIIASGWNGGRLVFEWGVNVG